MLRCLLFTYLLLSLLCASGVYAQNPAPVHAVDGEYIKEWLVIGPFFPDSLETDFLASVGGEANLIPEEGDTVSTEDERVLAWKRYTSEENSIDLLDAVGDYDKSIAYAFCMLQSETEIMAQIRIYHFFGAAVWLNGKKLHSNPMGSGTVFEFDAALKAGANTLMVKVSPEWMLWFFGMQVHPLPPDRAVLSGQITDTAGKPIPDAVALLEYNREEAEETRADALGNYRINIHPVRAPYDLSVTSGELGCWQTGIQLQEGERRALNLTLRRAISMEGTLLMLDDMTPHAAVPVQVIRAGEAVATTLSDARGKYRFINLKPGEYQVRCQVLEGYVYYRATDGALPFTDYEAQAMAASLGNDIGDSLRLEAGSTLTKVDFRFAAFKKGVWKNYTALDGLADNMVNAIGQDREGALWFGTYRGVSRYDGKEFITFTNEDGLAHDYVRTIHRDSSGIMWFGTNWGISRYDGRKFDPPLRTADGLPSNSIGAIHCDVDGALWLGTGWWTGAGKGVSRYDGKKFENFSSEDGLSHNTVWAIHSEPGIIWFGTHSGVSQYKDGKFVNLEVHYKGWNFPAGTIRAIHSSPDGAVWFGSTRGVGQYNGREMNMFEAEGGLLNTGVGAICSEPDGTIWFGCTGGLSRYDGKGFVNFTRQDGFTDGGVNALYYDSNGVLWVATVQGVFQYNQETLTNLTTKDGLANNHVYATYRAPEGALWFAGRSSVSRYDGNQFLRFTQKDGLRGNISTINRTPDGMMWFGAGPYDIGIFRYDGRDFTNFTARDGLAVGSVRSAFVAPDGTIWFGTATGLSYYDGRGTANSPSFTNFTERDGLIHKMINDIDGPSDGTLWVGTAAGLSRYNGVSFENFARGYITALHCAGDNVLWFSTGNKIMRYDGQTFATITPQDKSLGMILDIYSDSHDTVWFGTQSRGAIAYDGTAWTSLDTRDGLAGNIVQSITEDSDGSLWFSTDGGAAHYRRSKTRPGMHITSVSTEQDTYSDVTTIPDFTTGTYVTINYSAIDFKTVPEKRQYRCQVKELDKGWREPTRDAAFAHVFREPGIYTFMVQAIDRDLNYSEPASIELTFVPPFYFRTVFLVPTVGLGTILMALLTILSIVYVRHRQQLREAKKQLIVQERMASLGNLVAGVAHEINNPIGAIHSAADVATRGIHQIQTLSQQQQNVDESVPDAKKLQRSLQLLERNNQVITTASTRIAKVVESLRSFAKLDEATFQKASIHEGIETTLTLLQHELQDKVTVIKEYGDIPLIMCYPGELNQMFMHLLRNAIQALEPKGTIKIKTMEDDTEVTVSISDTGKGIPPENIKKIFDPGFTTKSGGVGTGLGLSIVHNIIQKHCGDINVTSEVGSGTEFIISLPIEQTAIGSKVSRGQ